MLSLTWFGSLGDRQLPMANAAAGRFASWSRKLPTNSPMSARKCPKYSGAPITTAL